MSRAVVIGGGIAGLSAANVLSQHFERVLLVDRDGQDVAHERQGVPQVDHLHVLMRRGWLALGELFPGIDEDLSRAGAVEVDWGTNSYWVGRFGAFPRPPSDITSRLCSRRLLEKTVRARLVSNPRIELVERFEAETFRWDSSRRRILAVKARDGREVEASLFVDASGRNGPFRSFRRMAGTRVLRPAFQADNFVMMGDALCSFNPIYGQGMTVSLLSALELGRQLAREGRTSQKRFNELVMGPWLTAAGEDLRVPGCTLENVSATRRLAMMLNTALGDRVMLRATFDPDAHQRAMRVLHMVDPPSELLPLALPRVG